jgi:hypothetical protein
MKYTQEDIEQAAKIIDMVLEASALHKQPHEDGGSPTFCMGLETGNTVIEIAEELAKFRVGTDGVRRQTGADCYV